MSSTTQCSNSVRTRNDILKKAQEFVLSICVTEFCICTFSFQLQSPQSRELGFIILTSFRAVRATQIAVVSIITEIEHTGNCIYIGEKRLEVRRKKSFENCFKTTLEEKTIWFYSHLWNSFKLCGETEMLLQARRRRNCSQPSEYIICVPRKGAVLHFQH